MTYANDMPVDAALASELRTTVMRLARRLRNQRTDDSLSLSQIAALGTLVRLGPLTPSELAAQERVQPPSMTRLLAKLEDAGLVTRTDHPTDGRQVLVAASPAGQELIKADRKRRDAWLALRLRDLTSEERETLHRAAEILGRLAET